MCKCKISPADQSEFIGQVIEIFEDFLEEKGISLENDEKAEDPYAAIIYGSDYGSLQSKLESLLINWQLYLQKHGGGN